MISGCRPDENLNQDKNLSTGGKKTTILGEKLKNPYTVCNMKAAYKNLKTGHAGGRTSRVMEEEFSIRPTHYYVRFLPDNWAAYENLKKDTSLFLLDRPIDVKVEEEADYYHDPSVPKDNPTWQYTSVPLSYKVPFRNKMEIMDTLYLPEKVEKQGGRISAARQLAMDVLENEALLLTDNLTEEEKKLRERNTDAGGRTQWFWNSWLPDWWTPAGRIRVWDERANGHIGVLGAKVRAWRWFSTGTGWVNSRDGRYVCDNRYRYNVCYKVIWEGFCYDIRDGWWVQANFNGPNFVKGDWDVDIENNGKSFVYAHMTRAMHRYLSGDNGGLIAPIFGTRLKYAMIYESGDQIGLNIGNWTIGGINPNIFVYAFGPDGRRQGDQIYATICHETAHSTHISKMGFAGLIQFAQVETSIIESWATAVEWFLTQMEYRDAMGIANYGQANFGMGNGNTVRRGMQGFTGNPANYTPLFIDLVDNFNQFRAINNSRVNDQVTGYTLGGIEGYLRHVYGNSSLGSQLKENKPAGVTDAQIDLLLSTSY